MVKQFGLELIHEFVAVKDCRYLDLIREFVAVKGYRHLELIHEFDAMEDSWCLPGE